MKSLPIYFRLLYVLIVAVFANDVQSQKNSFDPALYEGMEYRLLGPFRGGRSCTAVGVRNEPNLYYFGSVGGGVWRTKDGGNTYENISDGYFGGSIGAVAVSESDPNVIYVGQGEKTVRGNVSSGFGVWKSTDAGETWKHIGLTDTRHIGRIRIHPKNSDIVYVAAMGDLWKSSEQRGVFKSIDGGATWNKILYANEDAGAVDLILDPNDASVLYASTWNVRRTPYSFSSGGPGSELWKSVDSGENWVKLTDAENLPPAPRGIIGIAVSPVNSNRLYALIEAEDGGVYRSDDAGDTWEKVSRNRALRSRAWYYTRIYADTQDEDKVWVMNVSYGVSTDGGKTWDLKNAPHGDHHDLWIDPDNNQRMIIADDGGAQISNDAGENWTTYYNQPTAQFYRLQTDNHFPYRIYAAQQDNSAIRISHRSSSKSITENDWEVTAGGESASHAIDPFDNEKVYGGTYKGYMYRYNHNNGQRRYINVWPLNPAGSGVEVMKYRFNWNFPVAFSQHEKNKLYVFSNQVHVSTNEGQSWETISPDLTRNDPETQKSSGGPITQDNTGVEFYANIFCQAEHPEKAGIWWTGSDDGLIHLTQDHGETWNNVTPEQAPKWIMWNSIDPHPTNPAIAYIAGTMYKSGDFAPYLYKTKNFGKSWEKIINGIADTHFTRVLRVDPKREGLLYAGSEYGMYISFDDGAHWSDFKLNLPEVSITDLKIKNDNLIVATQGRSIWIMDDLTPLHQLTKKVAKSDAHLYQPAETYRIRESRGRYNKLKHGKNRPNGTIIQYYLKDTLQKDEMMSIEILEENGTLIQRYASNHEQKNKKFTPKKGFNSFVWDMRYPDAVSFDGIILYSSNTKGPLAVPGTYKVRMETKHGVQEQEFEIKMDPRSESTIEDLQAQFDFLINVRNKLSEANQSVVHIREVRMVIDSIRNKVGDKSSSKSIKTALDQLDEQMTIIENNIHETRNEARQDPLNFGIKLNNRLAFLATHESAGDFRPTDQTLEYYKEVSGQIDSEVKDLHQLFEKNINSINKMLMQKGIDLFLPKMNVVRP